MPVRTAAPLPMFSLCRTIRTVLSPSWRKTSRVPPPLPSSTTMISRSMPSGRSTARMRRSTSTTVLRSLKTGTMIESFRSLGGVESRVTTGPLFQVPRVCACEALAQLDLRLPPEQLARPADVGAAARRIARGERLEHQSGFHARNLAHELGELEHGELHRVADVHRPDDIGVEQRQDASHFVFDEAEGTGLRAGAVDGERSARDRLHEEVRHDAPVGRAQPRAVRVED